MGLSATLAGASGAGDAAATGTASTCRRRSPAAAATLRTKDCDADHAPHCHGARRRPRRAHAAADRPDAEAAGSGRRQAADRSCAGSPRRRRASSARWSTCTTWPTRSSAISKGRTRAADRDLRRARRNCSTPAAAWSRRSARLGGEPFFHVNSDTIWIDGVKPNLERLAEAFDPAAMDALLLLAPAATSIGYAGPRRFHHGRRRPAARGAASAKSRRSSMPARRSCAPELFKDAPHGRVLADRCCSTAPPQPAGCMACASKACGCMSARPRRSPRPRPRSRPARR